MDPYSFKNAISASKLFENKHIPIQEQYIIKSDKIIYMNDGKVLIEELVTDNWVEYLRKDLKDKYSITSPSKKTIEIINKFIKSGLTYVYNDDKVEFEGNFLKWGLELDDKSVKLTVVDYNYRKKKWNDTKKQLDILPSFRINGSFDFENTNFGAFLNRLNDWTSDRILPASSYITVYKNLYEKFGESELFKEFLKRNIDEEFYLVCYGRTLMETFISVKDDKWVRTLGGICVDKCMHQDKNNHLISKISLLSIIFENFNDLSENHPAFIASTLAFFGIYLAMIMNTIDRVISFLIIFGCFTLAFAHSLHLLLRSTSEPFQDTNINMFEKFGSAIIASYYMMITVSFFMLIYLMNLFIGIISNLVSNENNDIAFLALKREIIIEIELLYMLPHQRRKENWFPYVIFYECQTVKLREHVMDIQKDKWLGYRKPFVSENLNDVLHLPEEPPSLKHVVIDIRNLKESMKESVKTLTKKLIVL
ncbi:hypothetical protein C2G38_2136209 [Gigaspora rosea]|uniref:Uncharacterized protein n=1 Tax=Gigaspora rosea TaxID=44941 RepID=A0A397W7V4_9GLOM|nr:hypothetical protein C2G38_2136209 [Gigaspora rosea]